MSTTAAVPDKKGVVSSLSADAAEFVPLAAPFPEVAAVKGEVTNKGGAPASVQMRDVPQFLTSCFPFVQLDGELRTDANRFPLPLQFPGIPHTVPMPSPAPVRLPPWQSIRPELLGGFPPQPTFGSLQYLDPIATVASLSQDGSKGEGLLPTPVGLPLPGLHNTPGLILAAQPGQVNAPPWLLTSAPPPVPPPPSQPQQQHSVFLPSQQQQQHQPSLVSVPSTTSTTVSASTGSVSSTATSQVQASQTFSSGDKRPSSPVFISRSAQTHLPKQIHNFNLEEKPHPLYIKNRGKHKQRTSTEEGEQDSDSGYNSPLQAKKLVSCGTQVFTAALSPHPDKAESQEAHTLSFAATAAVRRAQRTHGAKEEASATEDAVGEAKKRARKKKEPGAGSARSLHSLGSASKLLSRSSSSISSAGTRPEEDDEKIDLHSWTDFPPMVPKSGGNVAGRPVLPSQAPSPTSAASSHGEVPSDRVALTIERTAHAPPWTIKYSGGSGGGSRSSSGEKEKCGAVVSSAVTTSSLPENSTGHTKNVRGNKLSKGPADLGQELSKLISSSDVGSMLAAAVHKPNSTCVPATTVNSSPVAATVTSTVTRALNTSVVTTAQPVKGVPYSQVMKGPTPATGFSNPGLSMSYSPVSALSSATLAPAYHGPALSTSCPVSMSVPPPPLLLSGPCVNQQVAATGGRPPLPIAFSGPPPPFGAPPPPLPTAPSASHSTQTALNMAAFPSFPGLPIPPLYHMPPPPTVLGQHHQTVRPGYPPPPPVPGLHPQAQARAAAPAASAPTNRLTTVATGQGPAQSSQEPNTRRSGSGLLSQESITTAQTNNIPKNSLALPASQSLRSPHGAACNSKSSPTSAPSPNHPSGEGTINTVPAPAEADGRDSEDKKRRRRRRRRGRASQGMAGVDDLTREGSPGLEHAISSSNVSESTLHFEDVDEFPDLLSAGRGYLPGEECGGADRATLSGTSLSYSDVIKATWSKASSQSRTQSLTGSCVSCDDDDNASNHTGTSNLSKRARKRRRRREQANKAAEVELAEISLEQQWLQQVGLRKSPTNAPSRGGLITNPAAVGEAKGQAAGKAAAAGGKKYHQPIAFDIAAMIDAIQKKPAPQPIQPGSGKSALVGAGGKSVRKDCKEGTGNLLDSTAPLQKRGKEREMPRAKKPSPLKKVILKEREQRKRLRLLDGDPDSASSIAGSKSAGVGMIGGESELSQEALSSKSEGTDEGEVGVTAELSADLSPISQTSPISMSPASPGNSGVSSPSAGSIGRDPVIMKIHSRRFREYCTQILDKEIDQCCTSLLQELVKFQDRMYHKDPIKAKSKRRVVLGLREVTKHLKLKRIKCVVISPNLEKIQSKGGLDEALNTILTMCQEQNVPFVFALGRRALGRACAKLVPVSVVGIFNYEGCESKYHSLISLTAAARDAYHEMVQAVEREVAEHPASQASSSIAGVPGLFAAHMGHSRTPSGCSAISFTSSILSEPISENFPHAEPEVDSKGYEIVRDAAGNVVHSQEGKGKAKSPNDIDDGNEADVEDMGEIRRKRRAGRNLNSVRFGSVGSTGNRDSNEEQEKSEADSVPSLRTNTSIEPSHVGGAAHLSNHDATVPATYPNRVHDANHVSSVSGVSKVISEQRVVSLESSGSKIGADPTMGLPVSHIDSIHSRSYNLGEAILSQHTSLPSADSVPGSTSLQTLPRSSLSAGDDALHSTHGSCKQGNSEKDTDDDDDNDVEDDLRISAVDDDSNDDNYDDDEEEDEDNDDNDNIEDNEEDENDEVADAVRNHHRIIDKERIKNWLESQTTVAPED